MHKEGAPGVVGPEIIWAAALPIEQRVLALASFYGLQKPPSSVVFVSHAKRESNHPGDLRAGNNFRGIVGKRTTQWSTAAEIARNELNAMYPGQHIPFYEVPFSVWPDHQRQIEDASLVMCSPYPSDLHSMDHIAQVLRDNTALLVGGAFATRNPRLIKESCPQASVLIGRMEGTLPYFLHRCETNSPPIVANRTMIGVGRFNAVHDYYSLSRTGQPNKSNTHDNPAGVVVESILGCNERCTFCSILSHVENPRDPLQVIQEIRTLHAQGVNYILFADDNLSRNTPNNLAIIFSEIKRLGMAWAGEGSREILDHPELAKLMGETNIGFLHGIDDLSETLEGAHNQKMRTPEQVIADLEAYRKYGFIVFGSIVVGLDNHRYPDTFVRIRDNAQKTPIPFIVQTAVPFPGTPFHTDAKKEGRLLSEELRDYNFGQIIFKPLSMTVNELNIGTRWLQRELASPERVIEIITKAIINSPQKFINHPRAILSIALLSMDNGFTGLTSLPDSRLTEESESLLNKIWQRLPSSIRDALRRIS